MVGTTEVIDIAGDLYTTKKNANTNNGRKTMRYLDKLGIRSIDKFKEIYGVNDEDVLLIEKYLKYGYDEQQLNIDDTDKDKLIEILTNGLNFYKNQVEIIEKLNKLKNSPTSVRDYIVIKKYNSIAELIHNIKNPRRKIIDVINEPMDDEKIYKILAHTAWYLTKPKNKRPESIKQLVSDIDNADVSIQDIVNGIQEMKRLNDISQNTKNSTRKKRYSSVILPFEFMDEKDNYTTGIAKMRKTQKSTIKGGSKLHDIFTPFIYLHRYLEKDI